MSTYTTTYSCGHSRQDLCQHCEEDTTYVSPDLCPACYISTVRWPSFGPLPCCDDDDDDEEEDEEEEDNEKEETEDEDEDTMDLDDDESGSYIDDSENGTQDMDTDTDTDIETPDASSLDSPVSETPPAEPTSLLERKLAAYGLVLKEVKYGKPKIVVPTSRPVSQVALFGHVDDVDDGDGKQEE